MLLVFFLTFRCAFAGTPHLVYGVPPVGTNFGNSQPQKTPQLTGYSSGTQWATNPYYQQSTQPWRRNDYHGQPGGTKPATSYWGGAYNNNRQSVSAAYQTGAKLISAASATYRPYSGSPPNQGNSQRFYNSYQIFPPTNNQYSNQRNYPNGFYNRPADASVSRYNDFLKRYYDWYYQNAYREASPATGYYPPANPRPPGEPGHHQPLGAYPPPSPPEAGGGSSTDPSSKAPWWLHGGFTGPAPVASSSSGGPVGPFTAPPAELSTKRPTPKKASLSAPSKLPGKAKE